MDRAQTFAEFLATEGAAIPLSTFLANILLTMALCEVLALAYQQWGTSLSNRRVFSRNFVPIGMTTMLVISLVKSSLALSLGLVGALSIVRFRTAIKEPEELTYLFLALATGLGFGANQRLLTMTAFVAMILWFMLRRQGRGRNQEVMALSVISQAPDRVNLESLNQRIGAHCTRLRLKRFDRHANGIEALYHVEVDDFDRLKAATDSLLELDAGIRVTFLDSVPGSSS